MNPKFRQHLRRQGGRGIGSVINAVGSFVKVTGFREFPNLTLYPTLEVRGTLLGPKTARPAQHPAPVVFSQDDLLRVLNGFLLTKVIYLEDPEQAIASASKPDQPLEFDVSPGSDPVEEARLRGRPVLIVRMGEREVAAEELVRQSIPGTLLFIPMHQIVNRLGEPEVMAKAAQVGKEWGAQIIDINMGCPVKKVTKSGAGSALLCDPPRAGEIVRQIRAATGLVGYETLLSTGGAKGLLGQAQMEARQPSFQAHQNEQLEAFRGRQRSSGAIGSQRLEDTARVEVLTAVRMEIGPAEAQPYTATAQLPKPSAAAAPAVAPATTSIAVPAPQGRLPNTGLNVLAAVIVALALCLTGAVLLVAAGHTPRA